MSCSQGSDRSVITTIGFLKEAPAVNVHGFNVYHKNRLILPFWHVVDYSRCRGKGVVGVLEANFIEPTHNKQDFEKSSVFQKLETRLKAMTLEYWDYHCGLVGYQAQRKPRASTIHHDAAVSSLGHSIYKPVVVGSDSGDFGAKASFAAAGSQHEISGSSNHEAAKSERCLTSFHQNTLGATLKRKRHDHIGELGVKKTGVGPRTFDGGHTKQLEDKEAVALIQETQKIHALCEEYEKTDEELNLKITRLKEEVQEAQREYVRMRLESKLLEKVKKESREIRPV